MNATKAKQIEYKLEGRVGQTIIAVIKNQGWLPTRDQLRNFGSFEVYCNSCTEKIAEGKYWKDGDPKFHHWDVKYFYRLSPVSKKKNPDLEWLGAYEFNINPKSHELRCVCCCGNNWKVAAGIMQGQEYKDFEFRVIN